MVRDFATKLRITASVLGCASQKDLCARFREVNPGTRGADGIEHDSLLGERREVPDVRRRESQRLHGDHSGPRGKVLPPAPYALHPDRREILLPNRAVLLMMGTTRESMEELSETNRKYSFISAKDKTANQTRWYVSVKTSIGRTDTLVAIATTYYWKRVGLDRDNDWKKRNGESGINYYGIQDAADSVGTTREETDLVRMIRARKNESAWI